MSANSTGSGYKDKAVILPGLSLGTLIQIQFEGLGSSRSTLLGMDPGKFLIIQTPLISDIGTKVFEKNNGIVRYLSAGRVYAFRSTLLGIIKEPRRFSILSYPESLEVVNLRKFERISCLTDAELHISNNIYEGIVTDISMGGCNVDLNHSGILDFPEIRILEEVSLTLQLKDGEFLEDIKATVRSTKRDKHNLSLGLQFLPWGEMGQGQTGQTAQALSDFIKIMSEAL